MISLNCVLTQALHLGDHAVTYAGDPGSFFCLPFAGGNHWQMQNFGAPDWSTGCTKERHPRQRGQGPKSFSGTAPNTTSMLPTSSVQFNLIFISSDWARILQMPIPLFKFFFSSVHSHFFLSFFLGVRRHNLITGLGGWRGPN